MTKKRFWILAVLMAWAGRDGLRAQQKQPVTSIQPDVVVFFNLTVASSGAQATPWLPTQSTPPAASAGTSLVIDNHQAGAYAWTVAYASHGFASLSLTFQVAPDNSGGTAPGTWSDAAVSAPADGGRGINPNTSIISALTTTQLYTPWARMNLTAKNGTGSVKGMLYGFKINAAGGPGGGGAGGCPAGLNGEVQYNNAGVCGGTSGETATATRVFFANGTAPAPGISFADGQTGWYRSAPFQITGPDLNQRWTASGVSTFTQIDNDGWRCGEGDEAFQRGICSNFSYRISNNARFYETTDTGISWGDPAGGGAGTRVGIFRKTTDGASATDVYAAVSDGGALVQFNAVDLKTPGCTFANLATCFGSTSGTHSYCTDCTVTSSVDNTATSGGSGCDLAIVNGAYKCVSI